MKKLILLFLFSVVFGFNIANAQTKERRVYYLDCSYSMKDPNKIWKDVCNNLICAIESVDDETTELLVIPFAFDNQNHTQLNAFRAIATTEGKKDLCDRIKSLDPIKQTKTYHSDPLNDFYYNGRVEDGYITYMFFMTDGQNEEKPDKFIPLLNQWENKYGSKDVYGFYVMLHGAANNPNVEKIIDSTAHMWKVNTANVNINLIRCENNHVINVRDTELLDVPFTGNLDGLNIDIVGENNHYTIKTVNVKDNIAHLHISHEGDLHAMPATETLQANVKMNGGGKFDFLLTDKIKIICNNQKTKTFAPTFNRKKKDIERLGKVLHHPSFMWKEEETTELTDTLYLNFNKDAKAESNSYVELEFVDGEGNSISNEELQISNEGQLLKDNKLKVKSSDNYVVLKFRYLPKANRGKHQGFLKIKKHNLDQVPENIKWQIHYEKNMNPLAKSLMWIGLMVFACLLLWFLIIRPIKYPRFKSFKKAIIVTQNKQVVYNKTCQFKGARLVVFASQKEKQSFLNRIFTGRIETYVSPVFAQNIVFVPKKNGKSAFVRAIGYNTMPNPISRNGVATISNNQMEIKLT